MGNGRSSILNNKNNKKCIKIDDRDVVLDLLNEKESATVYRYTSNNSIVGVKPFKVAKAVDGNPEFKGYRTNKFF